MQRALPRRGLKRAADGPAGWESTAEAAVCAARIAKPWCECTRLSSTSGLEGGIRGAGAARGT